MVKQKNLFLDSGTDFEEDITILDANSNNFSFSGYSAFGQIKKSWDESAVADFEIVLTSGNINLQINAASTANLTPGKYMYDICILETDTEKITKMVEGFIMINPTISRQ